MKGAYDLMNMPSSACAYLDGTSPESGKGEDEQPEILFVGEESCETRDLLD